MPDNFVILKNANVEQIVRDTISANRLSIGFDPAQLDIRLTVVPHYTGIIQIKADVYYEGTIRRAGPLVNIDTRQSLRAIFGTI